jgi:hypothetical protein
MERDDELNKLTEQMDKCLLAIDRIEQALLGNEFNENGIVKRLKVIEAKLKRLDKAFYILLGIVTCGAYPAAIKILPAIKEYLK